MMTYPAEALFQPCNMGGYGFPRLSYVIQDRKLALLARIHEHGDHYTRWAAAAIEKSGTTEAIGRAPCLNRIRPGFWISSTVEYALEGGTILTQGTTRAMPPRDSLTDPAWRAGLTPSQTNYLATEDITSCADLVTLDPEFRATTWRTVPSIPDWLKAALPEVPPTDMSPPTLSRGQIWHVQPTGTNIGSPGSTFSLSLIHI